MHGHGGEITSLAFAPNGQTLAAGAKDQTVRLWQVADGTEIRTLACVTDTEALSDVLHSSTAQVAVAFAPDGRTLAAGCRWGTVRLWQVPDGQIVRTLEETVWTDIASLAFSTDGQQLVVGSAVQVARLWRVSDGELIRQFNSVDGREAGSSYIAFGANDQTIIAGLGGGWIMRWQTDTGVVLNSIRSDDNAAGGLALSADRQLFVYAAPTLSLGNAEGGWWVRNLITLPWDNAVRSVAFSANGGVLATGAWDGKVRIWAVPPGN
jgi:WD40 repeat protein